MAPRRIVSVGMAVLLGLAALGARAHPRQSPRDPAAVLGHAIEVARRVPLEVRLVDGSGRTLASARLETDGSSEVEVDELTATQVGDELRLPVGTIPGVPAIERSSLLDPLARRSARWEGDAVVLDGEPPARLVGQAFEISLGDGALLMIAPG